MNVSPKICLYVWIAVAFAFPGTVSPGLWLPVHAEETTQSKQLTNLRSQIAAMEKPWKYCEVEILQTKWNVQGPEDSSLIHFLRLDRQYRKHRLSFLSESDTARPFKMIQWDGRNELEFDSQTNSANRRDFRTQQRPGLLPFGVLLKVVGYHGSFAEFLTPDIRTALDVQIALLAPTRENTRVRRATRLPGSQTWDVIEVELSKRDLHPRFVRGFSTDADPFSELDRETQIPTTIAVELTEFSDSRVNMNMLLKMPATNENSRPETATALTWRVEAATIQPDQHFEELRIKELVGNPRIRTFQGRQQIREERFHPEYQEPPTPWPIHEKWLFINNILLSVLIGGSGSWLLAKKFLLKSARSNLDNA